MFKYLYLFILLLGTIGVFPCDPWFIRTFQSSSANIAKVGSLNFQPYLLYYRTCGYFDRNWSFHKIDTLESLNAYFVLSTGLTKKIDISFAFQMFHNWRHKPLYTGVGDSFVQCKYALNEAKKGEVAVALSFAETIPTGSYDSLSPDLLALDGSGGGAFVNNLGINIGQSIQLSDKRWFNWIVNLGYSIPFPVKVAGPSVYGGGFGARGTAYPGQSLFMLGGMELQIDQNWVFALDIIYRHLNKSRFKGYSGVDRRGNLMSIEINAAEAFSLNPAFEYNFDEKSGLIFGVWFTPIGRNAPAFYTPDISYYKKF